MISYAGIIRIRSAGMISARLRVSDAGVEHPETIFYYTSYMAKNQAGFAIIRTLSPCPCKKYGRFPKEPAVPKKKFDPFKSRKHPCRKEIRYLF